MKLSVCIVCLIILIITVTASMKIERFGMSTGTLMQLQSTSVPSVTSVPSISSDPIEFGPRPYFLY